MKAREYRPGTPLATGGRMSRAHEVGDCRRRCGERTLSPAQLRWAAKYAALYAAETGRPFTLDDLLLALDVMRNVRRAERLTTPKDGRMLVFVPTWMDCGS